MISVAFVLHRNAPRSGAASRLSLWHAPGGADFICKS